MMTKGKLTAIIIGIFILYLTAFSTLIGVFYNIHQTQEVKEEVERLFSYYVCECEYCDCSQFYNEKLNAVRLEFECECEYCECGGDND